MTARLLRVVFRFVPTRWRETVACDLADEAALRRLDGWRRDVWMSWHAATIAVTLRVRRPDVPAAVQSRGRVAAGLRSDVATARRMVWREPAGTAAIVLTLSLGIAATSAVYAVFNHLVFRPVPGVHDPDTLVSIVFQPENEPRTWSFGSPDAASLFGTADSGLSAVAAWSGGPRPAPVTLGSSDSPQLLDVEFVAPAYLDVLGVRARIGRLLSLDETRDGGAAALISEALWRRHYGGRPEALGQTIRTNDRVYTIVGVLERYRGWGWTAANAGDVWLPEPESRPPGTAMSSTSLLVARVPADTSSEALQSRLRSIYAPVRAGLSGTISEAVPWVYPGLRQGPSELALDVSFPLVLALVSLLTLLACANASNLLLARHHRRRQSLSVRRAIGASRWRLIRPLIVEAVCLATMAVAGGLAGTWLIVRLLEGTQIFSGVGALTEVGIDWRVASFAAAVGLLTILAFAVAPIVIATRGGSRIAIDASPRTTAGTHRWRSTLVAVQIAVSLALMSSAAVLVRSVGNLRSIDLGMNPVGVVSFTLNPRLVGATGQDGAALTSRALEALRARPDVAYAGTANPSPFDRSRHSARLRQGTGASVLDLTIETTVVSPDYFAAVGIPVVAGRTFSLTEAAATSPAVSRVGLINETLAHQLFGGEPAVGRTVTVGSAFGAEWKPRQVEIIGVVGDSKSSHTLRQAVPAAMLYEPTGGMFVFSRVFVRGQVPDPGLQARVYETMREVAPGLPLVGAGTLSEDVERLMPEDVAMTRLLALVAVVAVLLGASGVYAVTSGHVAERTRELGVRIALGATYASILQHVARATRVATIVGMGLGVAIYLGVSDSLASRLYGVEALDGVSMAVTVVILLATTVVAVWLPARRATRIDPMLALRRD
jgi:putative ABC transport system permease protein